MKMKEPHLVPLSKQAIEILTELKKFTGAGRYVFLLAVLLNGQCLIMPF